MFLFSHIRNNLLGLVGHLVTNESMKYPDMIIFGAELQCVYRQCIYLSIYLYIIYIYIYMVETRSASFHLS